MPTPEELVARAIDCPVHRTAEGGADWARSLGRRVETGELLRVAVGAYVPTATWTGLRPEQQHVVRIKAGSDRIRDGQVVSHRSAAALLTLPAITRWPARVHLLGRGSEYSTANRTFVVHADLSTELGGVVTGDRTTLVVTDVERTAVDVAMTSTFRDGVLALDRALALGASRDVIAEGIARRSARGRTRAIRAIEFADALAANVAESLARVRYDEIRAPRPVLQHRFSDPGEPDAIVDFWFPDQGVVVEFDGAMKYRDAEYRSGRTLEQVLIDEKYREDRIRSRAEVRGFVRLRWSDLFDLELLRRKLARAGIPLVGSARR